MINCYEEKKYITALWVKQVGKGATLNNLINRWKKKWNDILDEETAKEIINWCIEISRNLTYRDLLALRMEHTDRTKLNKEDERLIASKNLIVSKGSAVHHPGSLSSYKICDSTGNVLAGANYDLSRSALEKFVKRYK